MSPPKVQQQQKAPTTAPTAPATTGKKHKMRPPVVGILQALEKQTYDRSHQ